MLRNKFIIDYVVDRNLAFSKPVCKNCGDDAIEEHGFEGVWVDYWEVDVSEGNFLEG